jgi:ribulose-5-phosphate 4-epimerase/fuculose-1-phosphate aldolase
MSFDLATRSSLVELGAALYDRGLTPGRTGNLSVRAGEEIMITPTNVSMGRLDPDRLSVASTDGTHLSGDRPSKELVLHQALYRHHPDCSAVAHLHSTHAVAVSCLPDLNPDVPLPTITPYFAMRVGRLPLVEYAAPGSDGLEAAVAGAAERSRCVLLRNHGSLAAAPTLEAAVDAVEEIEETARLFLLLEGRGGSYLSEEDVADLRGRFPAAAPEPAR